VDVSPAPDDRSAAQPPGAGVAVETLSAEQMPGASMPLLDGMGESAGLTAADDAFAATHQQGASDAPNCESETKEALPTAQLVVLPAAVVPEGDRDEQVR